MKDLAYHKNWVVRKVIHSVRNAQRMSDAANPAKPRPASYSIPSVGVCTSCKRQEKRSLTNGKRRGHS